DRADRTRRGRDRDGLAWFRLGNIEQSEIGGEPGNAEYAEQMRHRLQLRHPGEMLCRYRRIILPAGIAEYDIAGFQSVSLRCSHFADAAAGHHRVGLDRCAI